LLREIKELRRGFSENVALARGIDKASMFEEMLEPPALKAYSRISKVAPSDLRFLYGETGTGKRAGCTRHTSKIRSPFARVRSVELCGNPRALSLLSCSAMKGAFTARLSSAKVGLNCKCGTLFLDEVGELPAETQIALLRVLQSRV